MRFSRTDGPTTLGRRLGRGAERTPLATLKSAGEERATTVCFPSGATLRTVEHLLAAVAGANAFDGIAIDVEGEELPLLDGGAAQFFDAIAPLRVDGARRAVVTRAATFEAHGTTLDMHPLRSGGCSIEIEVDFDEGRFGRALRGTARWDGDAATFREHIATARTFGAARELEWLRARGLAAHVPAGSVVGLDVEDPAYAPRDPEEPIRHKLLDAIGDLALLGARIEGSVRLRFPSHKGTHATVALARAAKIFSFD